jgi:polar amino acid transport system substrate-binding protein
MKKMMSLLLAVVLLASTAVVLSSCGSNNQASGTKLVCGVTEFEPMNFRDTNGNWTGFDTEFALAVGEKLGMEVEFQLIEWSNKFIELDSNAIDAIWNGFTATANEPDGTPRITLCDMSYSYLLNTQCIVVKADRASEFNSVEDLAGKVLAAEAGSAGETKARGFAGDGGSVIGVPAQINAFMEVKAGASDGAVIDIILAQQIAGSGDYSDLVIAGIDLPSEVYAIGFRKGDPLRDRVNQAMSELYADGTLMAIAQKYGLEERLLVDQTFGK